MYSAAEVLDTHWNGTIPVSPKRIAESMGMVVLPDPLMDESGRIEIVNGVPTIYYSPTDATVRKRFTIAHEIGHYAKGHLAAGVTMFRDPPTNFSSVAGSPKEREANTFAANLLMPSKLVKFAIEHRGMRTVEKLAALFGVSQVAMKYRLQNLGIVGATN